MKPVGQESMNLDTVEQLRVGRDQAWVQLPSLLKRRSAHTDNGCSCVTMCYNVTMLRCRRQHGCAVARSAAGNLGIVVVGGTGDSEADKVTSVQEDVVLSIMAYTQ